MQWPVCYSKVINFKQQAPIDTSTQAFRNIPGIFDIYDESATKRLIINFVYSTNYSILLHTVIIYSIFEREKEKKKCFHFAVCYTLRKHFRIK